MRRGFLIPAEVAVSKRSMGRVILGGLLARAGAVVGLAPGTLPGAAIRKEA